MYATLMRAMALCFLFAAALTVAVPSTDALAQTPAPQTNTSNQINPKHPAAPTANMESPELPKKPDGNRGPKAEPGKPQPPEQPYPATAKDK